MKKIKIKDYTYDEVCKIIDDVDTGYGYFGYSILFSEKYQMIKLYKETHEDAYRNETLLIIEKEKSVPLFIDPWYLKKTIKQKLKMYYDNVLLSKKEIKIYEKLFLTSNKDEIFSFIQNILNERVNKINRLI